jgi:ATP-dependent Clp protease, protease subunit
MLHAQEILNLKKRLNEIYMKHTGQPLQKIEEEWEWGEPPKESRY